VVVVAAAAAAAADFGAYVHNNILICFQKAIAQRWRWYANEPQHNHKNNNNIIIIMSCGSVIQFIAKYYSLVLRLKLLLLLLLLLYDVRFHEQTAIIFPEIDPKDVLIAKTIRWSRFL